MTEQEKKLAVHVAWCVAALIVMEEEPVDVDRAGEIVEKVCRKCGLDPYMFDMKEVIRSL